MATPMLSAIPKPLLIILAVSVPVTGWYVWRHNTVAATQQTPMTGFSNGSTSNAPANRGHIGAPGLGNRRGPVKPKNDQYGLNQANARSSTDRADPAYKNYSDPTALNNAIINQQAPSPLPAIINQQAPSPLPSPPDVWTPDNPNPLAPYAGHWSDPVYGSDLYNPQTVLSYLPPTAPTPMQPSSLPLPMPPVQIPHGALSPGSL